MTCFRAARDTRVPSHLFYPDDILIFCQASLLNYQCLHKSFLEYAAISGQELNPAKSKVYFGKSMVTFVKRRMQRSLGISEGYFIFTWGAAFLESHVVLIFSLLLINYLSFL